MKRRTPSAIINAYCDARPGDPRPTRSNQAKARRKRSKAPPKPKIKPFAGCDGEGAGHDEQGRQNYALFRMGESELFEGGRHLRTEEILDFICEADPHYIYVGFGFGYDVTQILRDLPVGQLERLFEPVKREQGHSPYVWYKGFDIEYLPKNYLRVRRAHNERDEAGRVRRVGDKTTVRTIYETFGNFQRGFVKCLETFPGVATEDERRRVKRGKDRRGKVEAIGDDERAYCALECELLARLMEMHRRNCDEAGVKPSSWAGVGYIATYLHKINKTMIYETMRRKTPRPVRDMAADAIFGGRAEISRTGFVDGRSFEYDLRSAHAAAMLDLPCLKHGRWIRARADRLARERRLFIARVDFEHDERPRDFCGLPVRRDNGAIIWPLAGAGCYWSPEIRSAEAIGARVTYHSGYVFKRQCACKPFAWVEGVYKRRQELGETGGGWPLKLTLAALYGKFLQRIGRAKYFNPIWGGLVTAITRSKLNDAIRTASPGAVYMLATDALYSRVPLVLDFGDGLGQWKVDEFTDCFVAQPGLYWRGDRTKFKSRGLSGNFWRDGRDTRGRRLIDAFEADFGEWLLRLTGEAVGGRVAWPAVSIPVPAFVGLRLALQRKRPDLAGHWLDEGDDDYERVYSLDPGDPLKGKRDYLHWAIEGRSAATRPVPGAIGWSGLAYADLLKGGGGAPFDELRTIMEDQPDPVFVQPPRD